MEGDLLLKFNEVLIPSSVVAAEEAVQFAGAFDRRNVGRLEGRPRWALKDGVRDGVGKREDGRGCRAERIVDEATAVGLEVCLDLCRGAAGSEAVISECLKLPQLLGDLAPRLLGRRAGEFSATTNVLLSLGAGGLLAVGPVCPIASLAASRRVLELTIQLAVDLVAAAAGLNSLLIRRSASFLKQGINLVSLANELLHLISEAATAGVPLKLVSNSGVFAIDLGRPILGLTGILLRATPLPVGECLVAERRDAATTAVNLRRCCVRFSPRLIGCAASLLGDGIRKLSADTVERGGERGERIRGRCRLGDKFSGGFDLATSLLHARLVS